MLSTIASRQLGNMSRWPEIARLNNLTGHSVIRPGQTLQMPCATGGKGTATHGAPLSAPVLVWTARPGEHLTDVISRWARKAGYTVVQDGSDEWEVDVPIFLEGDFKGALESLVLGFEASGRPLAISLYSNKIIRIGSPL